MHELGVVFYVVKDVKKVAEKNHVEKVSSVTLEIGEVSGILHDYLTDCWNWAKKKEPLMEEAELKIEQIEADRYFHFHSTDRFSHVLPLDILSGIPHKMLLLLSASWE